MMTRKTLMLAAAMLTFSAVAHAASPGDLPASFLGESTTSFGDMKATFLDKNVDVAEYDATSGRTVVGGKTTAGIFGAADRAVDQTIARYQSGTIGRAVATFWRDLFTRGTLYNPSSPGNIPGLFLSGAPSGPGAHIPASFLSGTVAGNVPSGFVADNLSSGSWDGKGFGHWSW